MGIGSNANEMVINVNIVGRAEFMFIETLQTGKGECVWLSA